MLLLWGGDADAVGWCRYDSVLPVHELWLGYMAELLALPVLLFAPSTAVEPSTATSVLLPTFPPRPTGTEDVSMGLDLKANAPVMQAKLVKAEFVGCKLVGASPCCLATFL